jgi:hypothetical protein
VTFQDTKDVGSLTLHGVGVGSARVAVGWGLKKLISSASPTTRWLIPGGAFGVLNPAGKFASTYVRPLAPVLRPLAGIAEAVNPIGIVALNPTNRFPSSVWENSAIQRHELLRQQDVLHEAQRSRMRELASESRNTFKLTQPQVSGFGTSLSASANRFEPFKLRPERNIATPFNAGLLHGDSRLGNNPFNLSLAGRSTNTPFGLNLGNLQLRPPKLS